MDLHTLLADSGYVTIHTALTDETEGLVDAAAIVRMRPGSVPSWRLGHQTRWSASRSRPWTTAIVIAGVYAGYFGAASGIILLAIISLRLARRIPAEPLRYMIGLSGLALAMSLAMV